MNAGETRKKTRIVKPVAVAVEGLDYYYTLLSQIKDDPQLQDVQLWDFKADGGGEVGHWLRTFATLDGYADRIRAIGIIRDAEDDAGRAFRSIAQAFSNVGLTAPARPMEVTPSTPAIGVLVMPHGSPSGCLEHAMLEAGQSNVPLRCAEEYLRCVGRGARNENWNAKLKVHALIAAGKNPAWTLSESVAGGLWNFAHPSLSIMKDFMRLLCGG